MAIIVESSGTSIDRNRLCILEVFVSAMCTKQWSWPSLSCIRWHWMTFLGTRCNWSITTDQHTFIKFMRKLYKNNWKGSYWKHIIKANLGTKVSVVSAKSNRCSAKLLSVNFPSTLACCHLWCTLFLILILTVSSSLGLPAPRRTPPRFLKAFSIHNSQTT